MIRSKVALVIFIFLASMLSACQATATPVPNPPTVTAPTPLPSILPTNTTENSPGQATDTTAPTVEPTNTENPTEENQQNVTNFPDASQYTWQPFVDGLINPLDMVQIPDGSDRFYVLEQTGQIRLIENGQLSGEPVLEISDRVTTRGNEQGLLGIALQPDFPNNRTFYLNYTNTQGNTIIARYQMNAGLSTADRDSEQVLIQQEQPYQNHNGGVLAFGPDQFLYIGLGDGGSGGDPEDRAQNPDTILGKILRIAVIDQEDYGVPSNNPYVNSGGRAEVWAIGLRNPWRFSFDMLTGDLYIADVGQNQWEEINYYPASAPGGGNFGWNYLEGTHQFEGTPPEDLELIDPVFEYDHSQGCSVTGGYVYRGQSLPDFSGIYLFGDFCSGLVWGLLRGENNQWQAEVLFQTGFNITSFAQDESGEIYLIERGGGIYKLAQ